MVCLGDKQIILSFLRLHPSTAFQTLLLTMMATTFLLRDSCSGGFESRLTKCGREELPTSEVRGSGLECQAAMAQEWPRGATLCPRSGVAGERSYPASEVRGGQEETPGVRGQGWPGGDT